MNYFVTAIGTDSGKSLISAIIVEALQADYWKPVQAGRPTDTDAVKRLISNDKTKFWEEKYLLETPASPHQAARIAGVSLKITDFEAPRTENDLIIEGAGGAMVPINDDEMMIDLVPQLDAEVIVVSNIYLGSINHTLLTGELLKSRGYKVKGVIFNGPSNPDSESVILHQTGWKPLLHLPQLESISTDVVKEYAEKLKENW